MSSVLKEILDSSSVSPTDGGERIPLHSSISPEEGALLQKIVSTLKPAVGLEIGLAYGVSALFLCEAMRAARPDARHIVIDPSQNSPSDSWRGIGLKNLERAGYRDMVEFHEKESQLALPELESRGTRIDLAFIDGCHTFDHALVDFFFVDRMLNVGGVVVMDDADMHAVHKVCRYIATNRAYTVVGTAGGVGEKISTKRRALHAMSARSVRVRRLLRPEIWQTDEELGLIGTCVAFRKESADNREWNYHREF